MADGNALPARRAVLGVLAALPAAAVPAAAAEPGDPHLEWLRRFLELKAILNQTGDDDARLPVLQDEYYELRELMEETVATSLEGAAARLAFVVAESCDFDLGREGLYPALANGLAQLGIVYELDAEGSA